MGGSEGEGGGEGANHIGIPQPLLHTFPYQYKGIALMAAVKTAAIFAGFQAVGHRPQNDLWDSPSTLRRTTPRLRCGFVGALCGFEGGGGGSRRAKVWQKRNEKSARQTEGTSATRETKTIDNRT